MCIAQGDKDVTTSATLRNDSGTTTTDGTAVVVPHSVQRMEPVKMVVECMLGDVIEEGKSLPSVR
jgi:hypothetical protein